MKLITRDLRRRWPGDRWGSGRLRAAGAIAAVASLLACAAPASLEFSNPDAMTVANQSEARAAAIESEVARVRAATSAFKSVDKAVAAGYRRDGGGCVDNQPHGAMGYHHQNDALLDGKIEVERPEMLVYERLPDGEYRLNGVEYIVPFSARPETSEPPTVMGQPLKPYPALKIWYLHVWVWTENPSGLFADWNPRVKCHGKTGGG
ncbi:MAG: hypothetical protein ACRD5G_02120 [Candidatus Acidiferrales bacterium]